MAIAIGTRWWRLIYVQVLIAIAIGIVLGWAAPETGKAMKPLGDAFIALIKMMIGPVIFCTVVHGIGAMGDLKRVGRVGVRALVYFELVSTLALVIGLAVGHFLQPGAGFDIDASQLNAGAISSYVTRAQHESVVDHLLGIIPKTFVDAFASGDLLQVLFVSVLSGVAIAQMGELGERLAHGIDLAGKMFFRVIGIVVRAAPIGAFGAMAFTVGAYGLRSITNLLELVVVFYITAALFVLVVLGAIARTAGFSILRYIVYLKEEILIVIGTSSSETVLPALIEKVRRLGASAGTTGLVVPTGYSFNLDGTNIYMTLAMLFLAQATNTPVTGGQMATMLLVAMLTSKGASGVTGAGFVTLAATLQAVPDIPIAALAILVGIDKFMSECRAVTNFIGNGVAALVMARWEGELSAEELRAALLRETRGADALAAPVAATARAAG
jgi:aerobic C4-dicarboxylate transport protein